MVGSPAVTPFGDSVTLSGHPFERCYSVNCPFVCHFLSTEIISPHVTEGAQFSRGPPHLEAPLLGLLFGGGFFLRRNGRARAYAREAKNAKHRTQALANDQKGSKSQKRLKPEFDD